jgi:hypothetical protein
MGEFGRRAGRLQDRGSSSYERLETSDLDAAFAWTAVREKDGLHGSGPRRTSGASFISLLNNPTTVKRSYSIIMFSPLGIS